MARADQVTAAAPVRTGAAGEESPGSAEQDAGELPGLAREPRPRVRGQKVPQKTNPLSAPFRGARGPAVPEARRRGKGEKAG